MSLKTLLTKIWDGIKELFADLPAELKVAVGIGVLVAQNIKNFVESPAADVLTAIIPGNTDNLVVAWLRVEIPKLCIDLRLVDATLGLTDPNEIVAAAIKTLQAVDPKISSAFLHNISILVAQVAADGKLSWSDGVYILEYYYKNEFEAAA